MEEKNLNVLLLSKIKELNEIEINKSKLFTAIFVKTTEDIVDKKMQSIKVEFDEQANYYNQKTKDYEDAYQEIISKYREQLYKIISLYNEFFINIQLELEESKCNQKIAIANADKSFDIKNSNNQAIILEEYTKKLEACKQKKINYDIIIQECEREINLCIQNLESEINSFFVDRTNQIAIKSEGFFAKIINSIKNLFVGDIKFKKYYLEQMDAKFEVLDGKMPDFLNDIRNKTINFVAKIKQAKDRTDKIFENMIS